MKNEQTNLFSEDNKVSLNDIKYALNKPRVRSYFEDIQQLVYAEASLGMMSQARVESKYSQELKCIGEFIDNDTRELIDSIHFLVNDNNTKVDAFITKDLVDVAVRINAYRSTSFELKGVNLNKGSFINVSNIFHIYGTEGFSIAFKVDGKEFAFVAQQGELKGSSVLNIYERVSDKEYRFCRDWNKEREKSALTFCRG